MLPRQPRRGTGRALEDRGPEVTTVRRDTHSSTMAMWTLIGICLSGLLGIVFFSLRSSSFGAFAAVASLGFMIAGASLLVGGLLGFLFGIPRTLQQDAQLAPAPRPDQRSNSASDPRRVVYQVNTNLEQISDWLTKILVGVGLTQLTKIPDRLHQIATYLAPGLGASEDGSSLAVCIVIFYLTCGFLIGYLWTRLFLMGAFRVADLAALGAMVERVEQVSQQVDRTLEEMRRQAEQDANALTFANRQLNPSSDLPPLNQEELTAAIKNSSPAVRVTIFNQAHEIRSEISRADGDKAKLERTIPIFRALIASDPKGQFHRNYAQLGYALKDQTTPAWAEAEESLSRAIEIRGNWEDHGWLLYEFNRAICRINLDPDYQQGRRSNPEARQRILDDLRVAAHSELKDTMLDAPLIVRWMELNSIPRSEFA